MKQVTSPLQIILLILVMAPIGAVLLGWMEGKVRTWSDLPAVIDHGAFMAFMTVLAWIFFKSPLSKQYTAVVDEVKESAGSFFAPATTDRKRTLVTSDAPITPETLANPLEPAKPDPPKT